MSIETNFLNILSDAVNNGVSYEYGKDFGDNVTPTTVFAEIDNKAFDKYLKNNYGDDVGSVLSSAFENYDIMSALIDIHENN